MTELAVPVVPIPLQRVAATAPAGTATTCVVVLPTYQEAPNIVGILERLLGCSSEIHVLVVDDDSPDGTADLAEGVGLRYPGRVEVLRRAGERGLGRAYRAGFAVALERGYDVVVQLDADGSHPVDRLPALLAALETGADVAIGSRYVDGGGVVDWPLPRRLLSRFGNGFARTLLGLPQHDVTGAYRAWRREALQACRVHEATTNGYGFMIEVAAVMAQLDLAVAEVPIIFREREAGVSKMSARIAWEAMTMVLRTRKAVRAGAVRVSGEVVGHA